MSIGATTIMNMYPTFYVNGEYLVYQRDFQNAQHCLHGLKYLGNPDFKNPSSDNKIHEQMKTNQYNLFQKFNQLEQRLNPLMTFISNLQKELAEEEKGE